jgi:uncharacterized membrane protein YczE
VIFFTLPKRYILGNKSCDFALFLGPKPEVYTKRQILSVFGALFYNPAFFIKLTCTLIEQGTGKKSTMLLRGNPLLTWNLSTSKSES